MNERDIKIKINKIKKNIAPTIQLKKEIDNKRNDLFAEILSEIDQDYDKLVSLVRTAKYELIFQEVIDENDSHNDELAEI